MTPQEFKAWFEGFTEAADGVPTKAQWKRIKDRVAEIDGKPITERIYVDRYWPSWGYTYPVYRHFGVCGVGLSSSGGATGIPFPQNSAGPRIGDALEPGPNFNSIMAMNTLGRIESSSMGAT